MKDLPAPLVIGGIWPGATVRLTGDSAAACNWTDADLALANPRPAGRCDVAIIEPVSGAFMARRVPMSDVLLELPGEDGGNAYRLDQRVNARTKRWADQGRMSDEFYTALGQAFPTEGCAWLSRYLVWTDMLAAQRGWPVGPGAPVYGWDTRSDGIWSLRSPETSLGAVYYTAQPFQNSTHIPALDGITDSTESLEAVWRSERAP